MHFNILKIEGWMEAVYGMRLSYQSQNKSDSKLNSNWNFVTNKIYHDFELGENDLKLMKKLLPKHASERKFLRSIMIWANVKMPLDWWSEWDTYKVGVTRLSGSTMHTLKKEAKSPNFKDQFHFDVEPEAIELVKRLVEQNCSISKIKKNLVCGFELESIVSFNYENAINIYLQRYNHKLEEWKIACNTLYTLPYLKDFILCCNKNNIKKLEEEKDN